MASERSSTEPMKESIGAGENVEVIVVGSSPIGKRKAEDADEAEPSRPKTPAMGKENSIPEKKPKTDAAVPTALVELKGKRLVYKQSPANFKTANRRETLLMLKFQEALLRAEESSQKMEQLPEEFYPLVVSAGHELQAPTETGLIKHIMSTLDNSADPEKSPLSINAIKALVPVLFEQRHYGFLPTDFPSSSSSTQRVPASLQIKCWEAKDLAKWFTEPFLSGYQARRTEREAVRAEVERMLAEMDDIEKMDLIKGDKGDRAEKPEKPAKLPKKPKAAPATSTPSASEKDAERTEAKQEERERSVVSAMPESSPARRTSREGSAGTIDSRRSPSPSKKSKLTPEEEEALRLKKEEKEARRVAREAEKAAKQNAVAKREALKAKQQAAMNRFFKAKPDPAAKSSVKPASAGASGAGAEDESKPSGPSDFQRYFKPVQQRANVDWAPINRWSKTAQSSSGGRGEATTESKGAEADLVSGSAIELLDQHFERHNRKRVARRTLPSGLKSAPLYGTVKEVWDAYQEAEDPRQVLEQMRSQARFPWKVLAFDQQIRPPYSGTFTKKSVVVGARTPFKQDPQLDYSYDSGDDWEEEDENADEIDEPEAEADPDDADSDEEDGEFDDWLDDTEDAGASAAMDPMDVDDDVVFGSAGPGSTPNRADQARTAAKTKKVPRKVIKLSPWWKGPEWEGQIGKGTEGLEPYRLQLLNNAPVSLDPFTYTSADPVQTFKTTFSTMTLGMNRAVKCLLSSDLQTKHVVPEEPPKSAVEASIPAADTATTSASPGATAVNTLKPRAAGPKVAFPDAHLGELLKLIEGNTKIRTDLVSFLRDHFEKVASKGAIEAKLKEVAVREGKSKDSAWRVKPEFWIAAGLPVPATATATPQAAPALASPQAAQVQASTAEKSEEKQSPLKAWMKKRDDDEPMAADE